jgi:Protein of unknown function (DUF2510)
MTDAQQFLVPAGWHVDPADPAKLRWWDGAAWTSHVADPPPVVIVPTPPAMLNPVNAQLQRETAYVPFTHNWVQEGAAQVGPTGSAQTFPVWLLVFSPLWSGAVAGLGKFFLFNRAPLIAAPVGLIAAAAVLFGLAWVDRSRLRNRGYSRAAHPAWVLLSPLAYLIARVVGVGPRSIAPLVTYVVFGILIIGIVVFAIIMASAYNPPTAVGGIA